MKTDELPEPSSFPTESLRNYALNLLANHHVHGEAYALFREACDHAILTAAPSMPQVKLAHILGMSRTTLRSMLRRLVHPDGRRKP